MADQQEPMQAREVQAVAEALRDDPVRRTSVKALLACNVAGASPQNVIVRFATSRVDCPQPRV
jgi:hypothetical protein